MTSLAAQRRELRDAPADPAAVEAARAEVRSSVTMRIAYGELAPAARLVEKVQRSPIMRIGRGELVPRIARGSVARKHSPARRPLARPMARRRGAGRPAPRRGVRCRSSGSDSSDSGEPAEHNSVAVGA